MVACAAMVARLPIRQRRGTTVLWNHNRCRRRRAGTWTARRYCLASVSGILCSLALVGAAGAQTPPTSLPSDASTPLIVGNVIVVPYAAASVDYITGLASLTILDSTTFRPKRVLDERLSTAAGFRGLYGPDRDTTIDFGYNLQALTYFRHDEFNFLDNNVGGGVTRRIDSDNTVSGHTDVSRAFATGSYRGYYWREHLGTAYAHDFGKQLNVTLGADYSHYSFDGSRVLDSDTGALSVLPQYKFDQLPLDVAVNVTVGRNLAQAGAYSFGFVEVAPSLTWRFANRDFVEASLRYGHYGFDSGDLFQTGTTRRDTIWGGSMAYLTPVFSVPKLGTVLAYGRYTHTQDVSTLARQGYVSEVVSVGLTARF
jgi:hypothetical protein